MGVCVGECGEGRRSPSLPPPPNRYVTRYKNPQPHSVDVAAACFTNDGGGGGCSSNVHAVRGRRERVQNHTAPQVHFCNEAHGVSYSGRNQRTRDARCGAQRSSHLIKAHLPAMKVFIAVPLAWGKKWLEIIVVGNAHVIVKFHRGGDAEQTVKHHSRDSDQCIRTPVDDVQMNVIGLPDFTFRTIGQRNAAPFQR